MKEEIAKKYTKTLQELTITDDFMFCKVMEDKEICIDILKMITGKNITDIKYVDTQKIIDISKIPKSIRLDVYVEDEDTVYNIEMQVTNQKELPKRTRYYRDMMDLNAIIKGQLYSQLPNVIIIVIAMFDPFGQDLPLYEFRNFCLQNKDLELNDGGRIIFLNAKVLKENVKDENLKAFLEYLNGNKVKNKIVERLERQIEEEKERWR